MKNAIIYTRVSTDEQAEKGYSLRYQEERLRQYCDIQKINIVTHYQDDYSAKTFDRPEFIRLKEFVLKNKNLVDGIIFVKWDRFSRNTTDAYNMIRFFSKIGIIVQAIEQPIDFSIPEQKMMLAFYLAYPEIENDRRSLNTRAGMIRAMKEGRWVSNAPIGYVFQKDGMNKSVLVHGEKASFIKELFEKYSTGNYAQEELRKEYNKKGLYISKSHIIRILTNIAYIGKRTVPKYKDEPERVVEGLHEPIISEETFYKVQEILTTSQKRGKQLRPKNAALPLRHHIKCPVCSNNLTGSASKGNGGKYYYYHCQRGCNTRFRASEANNAFLEYLSSIKIKREILDLYNEILQDVFEKESRNGHYKKGQIDKEIREYKEKQIKADNLLLEGKIDNDSHKRMVENVNNKISQLILDKSKFENTDNNYSNYVKYGFSLLQNLDKYYSVADLEIKDKLLSSIFPNKLIYENGKYRTNSEDNIISLLSGKFNNIDLSKKEKASQNRGDSLMVAHTGIEPVLSALRGRRVNQLH